MSSETFEQLLIDRKKTIIQEYIVYPNQSFLDIAMQEDGTVLAAFERAVANLMNVSDVLLPGQKTKSIVPTIRNKKVADYFKGKSIKIATAVVAKIEELEDYEFPQGEFPISL